ncbi:uncharacterized protein LOC134248744, partial [Saccostrea cucullata]|uniref:uncharacterized protein LOC134248744 n=1 Tax=Saccostrea cuccullata TaxID=36930 RepID=UPI002ED0EA31
QILAFLDCEISMKTIENDLGTNLIEMALSNDYSSQETVVENVKLLISKGADLKDPRIGSVLIEALLKKNHRIADFLIENGINLNYKDGSGNTVLHVLCDSHINETTLALGKKLLTAMCKVNEVNIAGETPLLMLLRGSTWYYHNPEKDDLIKCLLDNGADVNVKCPKDKKSTLRFAIECQYTELTKLLLNAGYDVNKREAGGELPIFYCFPLDTSKNTELFELILEAETFPNCVDSKGTSLLERVFQTLITERKHVGNDFFARVELPKTKFKIHDEIKPLFSLLLSKNANPNTAKEGEDSLLMKAITYEAEEIVLLLIKAGASMTHIGENISSPLDVCCRLSEKIDIKGSQEPSLRMKDEGLRILNILLDNNLPLGNPNSIGKYPLDIVMGFDNTETEIQKMLSMGADPNKYDKNEECPLLKSVYGSPSVTLDLLKAGADPQTTSKDGRSVYDLFTERIFYDDSLSCLDDGCAAEIQMRALARNEPSILMIEDTFYDCTTGSMIKSFLKKLNKRPAIKLCGKTMYVTYEDSVSCWKTVKWLEKFIETGDVRIDAKEDQNHWLNIKQKLNRRK